MAHFDYHYYTTPFNKPGITEMSVFTGGKLYQKFYSNTILHDYNEAMPHQTIKWNHNIMNQIQNLNSHSHDQSVNQSSRLFQPYLVVQAKIHIITFINF